MALELEAMGLDEVWPELAVGYVDHLLIQGNSKNVDDHLFPAFRASGRGVAQGRADQLDAGASERGI